MDKILERLKNPLYAGLAGFLAGLIVGLPILGWLVWPVQWTDAAPQHLRKDLQVDYLRMTIDSFKRNEDEGLLQKRWQDLGSAGQTALKALAADPGTSNPKEIEELALLVQAPVPAIKENTKTQPAETKGKAEAPKSSEATKPAANAEQPLLPEASKPAAASSSLKDKLPLLLGVMCTLTLIVAGLLVYLLLKRKKTTEGEEESEEAEGYTGSEMEYVAEESTGGSMTGASKKRASSDQEEPPVVQFMTTYMLGDDLYDDSFSIDAPTGEFLGECGVGISETIGVGDPKKVTAFEVWLFDKNDIQTVTKVLMSNHAFNDPNIRQRLLAKGEPQLVEPGKRILLETASLQMEARIVDASYGGGAMPTNSYFDRLTLELAVWPKNA
ncbi:hypothetical protein [Leptolinea tardivitalis]|uniref:Uncharacterized protein n=1 Tax=Leptolinea tardivitalis TaxID=229920 RepID=A0A0P6WZ08_9CHLR|nr:hypothetical protein [Leptolinea tardivitalis]KPL71912.1 hypothetical protein ADM99_10955 [Leptolinea tardivitalis]GAP20324.1 hypothetical protein LTAR_00512 [Leptolinea tardivitalis]